MRRKAQRDKRRRGALIGALAAVVVLGGALGIWALAGRSGTAGDQSLYRFSTGDFHSLAFEPTDANTIYFGHHGGLKVSRDGGRNWQDTSLQKADAMGLALPSGEGNRRYVAGHDVFRVSADGGKTWRDQPTNLPGLDLHAFAASPTNALRLYAAPVGKGLFTSGDGGVQWQPVVMPSVGGGGMGMIGLAVAYDDPLHLYAGSGSRVAESRDGGRTWQEQPGPAGAIMQLAVGSSGVLYAGTDRGLAQRGADGAWQLTALPSGKAVVALAVSPADARRVAVVDEQGRFYRSDDSGQTWASK